MIFYGTNSSRLKDGQLNNVTCPNCENQTSMTYGIFGKYFYLYWIPVFPLGKTNVLECNSCKKTFKLKELPHQIKHKFETEKHSGVPIWHFSGLAIIACIVAFVSYSSSKHKEDEAIYVKEPAVGDVYSYKVPEAGNYSTMKVSQVLPDSIYVFYNDYLIDKSTGISSIDKSSNYTTATGSLSRQEVINLYDEDVIYNIDRD